MPLLNSYLYKHNLRYFEASALAWAASKGVVSTIEMMVEAGASPNLPYHRIPCGEVWQHFGPIILAIKRGNEAVVNLLLEKGVDPDPAGWVCSVTVQEYRDEQGDKYTQANPIFWALAYGQKSILRILVAHAMKRGPIQMATLTEDQAIAEFYAEYLPAMVNKQSQVHHNVCDYFQSTPLMEATQDNNSSAVRSLLRAGANPDLADEGGYSRCLVP